MHIIDELKFVSPAMNFLRGNSDGIYKRGNDYFLTFVHGGEDGTLSIQVHQFKRLLTSPAKLRGQILNYLGVDIPKDARIFINPCSSEACMAKWKKSCSKYKVFIVSGKSDLTSFIFADYQGELILRNRKPNKRKKYMMFVFDYSNEEEYNFSHNLDAVKQLFVNHVNSRIQVNKNRK